jgi:amino acid adenylation domain-containing protein
MSQSTPLPSLAALSADRLAIGEPRYISVVDYPQQSCVHELFEERAMESPHAVALVSGETKHTYFELNQKANRLAHYLIKRGVKPNTPVGILLDRSPEMVIAVLGVLKAGGAYAPYDPSYPRARLEGMLDSVEQSILLTASKVRDRVPVNHPSVVVLDKEEESLATESTDDPRVAISLNDLAYVIFTSGSTGRPKATAVHHGGWRNLLNWFTTEFAITSQDKVLLASSFSFDITQRALAMPLVSGGELHLLESEHFSPERALATIEAEQITLLNCAPSPFYTLFENRKADDLRKLRSLRHVFLGGEAISGSRLREWCSSKYCSAKLVNVYGVAECSDVSTFYQLEDFNHYASSPVPAGRPIFNTRIYLMDETPNPVSDGEVGEICIAGAGVGKGYLNDPALTAQKFVRRYVGAEEELLYRTGDIGRLRADGNIEYLGRADHQVKVHGIRVELEEIEAALRQHPNTQEAIVLVREGREKDQLLIAYILPKEQIVHDEWPKAAESFRRHLKSKLPQNVVPNTFIKLTEVPLNPNGKIDRSALQKQTDMPVASDERKRTTTEIVVGAFVAEALGLDKVELDDDFFDMGGHSLKAIQVVTRINENFGTRFDLALFSGEKTTVTGLSARVNEELKRRAVGSEAAADVVLA